MIDLPHDEGKTREDHFDDLRQATASLSPREASKRYIQAMTNGQREAFWRQFWDMFGHDRLDGVSKMLVDGLALDVMKYN